MRATRATVLGACGLIACVLSCNQLAGIREPMLIEECDGVDGTPLPEQTPGDCAVVVCNGKGGTRVQPSDDPEDDQNICTEDVCIDGTTVHRPLNTAVCYTGTPGTQGIGQCRTGTQQCMNGVPAGDCIGEVVPEAESCTKNGDEDCDGEVNEGCACIPGEVIACYSGPAGTQDVGACHSGTQTCKADGSGYGSCVGERTPEAESCDAAEVDENCDGEINEEGADCVCGDGYISIGETCDDGGTSDADACSSTCQQQEVLQVAAGNAHTCALLSGGIVKCWGHAAYGALGLGDTENRGDGPDEMGDNLPAVNLGTGKTATAISTGQFHTCAIIDGGSVKCWGQNDYGQLGLGDIQGRGTQPNQMGDNLPALDLGTGKTALAISAGLIHTCALLNDFSIKCWGANTYGRLGLGDTEHRGDGPNEMGDSLPAVNLGTGKIAIAVSTNHAHTCAVLNDGALKCWGFNLDGQLGLGDVENRGDQPGEMGDYLPVVNLGTGKTALVIAASTYHTCAVLNDGNVKCWGNNDNSQLGLGDAESRGDSAGEMGDALPAVDLGTGRTALAISSAVHHNCAILDNASIKCWGLGANGKLGLGNTMSYGGLPDDMGDNLPAVALGTGKAVLATSVGISHSCALLSDASTKCWGSGSSGRIGIGNTLVHGDSPGEMGDNLPTVKLFSSYW